MLRLLCDFQTMLHEPEDTPVIALWCNTTTGTYRFCLEGRMRSPAAFSRLSAIFFWRFVLLINGNEIHIEKILILDRPPWVFFSMPPYRGECRPRCQRSARGLALSDQSGHLQHISGGRAGHVRPCDQ